MSRKIKGFLVLFCMLVSIHGYSQWNKFYVGMFTMDFDQPKRYNCAMKEPYNADPVGHDDKYLETLVKDNFNLIIPWTHYLKPYEKFVSTKPDTSFLGRARRKGLSVLVCAPDNHLAPNYTTDPVWYWGARGYDAAISKAGVAFYKNHPAVIGWFLLGLWFYNIKIRMRRLQQQLLDRAD